MSLRQAVRPAVFAHGLMAGNREGAVRLAAECDELLQLTRELLHATGRAALLGAEPESSKDFSHNGSGTPPRPNPDPATAAPGTVRPDPINPDKSEMSDLGRWVRGDGSPGDGLLGDRPPSDRPLSDRPLGDRPLSDRPLGDRPLSDRAAGEAQLLDAYTEAAMAWAKVAGSLMAIGGTLLEAGDWADVRRLADVLADTGEAGLARDLRVRLGAAVFGAYRDRLQRIGSAMPPPEIARSIETLRAVLREVPEDFPDRNREVNRLLAPLAVSVHKVMKARGIDAGFDSRVEHIATGGVAGYPEIVATSLDELAAEFEGLYR